MTGTPTPLLVEDQAGVRILTLNRPEARNAFNDDLYDAARFALQDAASDEGISACLITGAGDVFSAGHDLKQAAPAFSLEANGRGFVPFVRTLATFDKPLIAAVDGPAVGLGVTMLLHCDVVIVSEAARFRTPFVALGIVPEAASSVLLPARIGTQAAAHMLFTTRWIDAEQAVHHGLAWKCCPSEALLQEALATAKEIATMPLEALVSTKRLLLAARSNAVRAALDHEFSALLRCQELRTPSP